MLVFAILRNMRSHCGECFCFGIAKLARVLVFCLACFLVLVFVLFFSLLFMVAVCGLIEVGFLLLCNVMSFICHLIICDLEGISPTFVHLGGSVDCSCLSCCCVT